MQAIRPFIGAADFELSRHFYRDLGFTESVISPALSVFFAGNVAFYLQNAYVRDWIDNTMVFVEVDDLEAFYEGLVAKRLPEAYPGVRVLPIRVEAWGKECFVHDPAGVLWHFGVFFR